MAFDLLVVLLLIAANGVFAGAEIAVLSLRKTRLQELVELDVVAADHEFDGHRAPHCSGDCRIRTSPRVSCIAIARPAGRRA